MKKYVILMKDKQTQQAYFYNFDDGYVYRDDQTGMESSSRKGAAVGAFVGMLCSGILGTLGGVHMPALAPLVCAVSGLLLGMFTYVIVNQKVFFRIENRLMMSKEHMVPLYEAGSPFRRSYLWTTIGFGLFCVGAAAMLLVIHKRILVICVILSWWVMGIMVWGIRPILQMRLRKWLYE